MTRKQRLIDLINKTPITSVAKFQLDNLDWAELIEGEDGVEVENEHGTILSLNDLSDQELDVVAFELDLGDYKDYLIMTENNEWVSTWKFAKKSDIDEEVEQLKKEYPDTELIVFMADEMTSYTV